MTIIESVRNFIRKCPHLDEFAKGINIEFLNDNVTSYSIETVPADAILKRFVNGDCIKQFVFIFASIESYGNDILQNIENSDFYEKFAKWIETQNNLGELPELDGLKESLKIEVTTPGYPFQTDIDKAQYQIQLRLKYFEKGEIN
ncbi:chloramphenicol resistance protein [Clostridioides difficile]|uniref:chloramphenicol resistance protein n=1 Tax=Clostridioides difficile TaxID=1496 RepID=UPI000C99F5F4|nr:chloramphenicol resistance protein [Clostridioides difficile]MBH7462928.1 chloramphenicol resistance protein [Clostridioides difficile]MBY1363314.1 chloramphenicol resistance protein [Clostridioides difficile]MBY1861703.1 chloramphenicol resistance protein [Clostridioides difficile]MBZ0925346.1 chloramphenicol resistance protein [Clostridioides difficile]MCH7327601.1 chloramphenicol resistance protein [Clostridioides difficile]